jgi:ribonuclease HII
MGYTRKKLDPHLIPPQPDLSFEQALWAGGIHHLAGIDEAGRGPLAGPVAAAAVMLPPNSHACQTLIGLRDSKQLSPSIRDRWAADIKVIAITWGVGFASSQEIDDIGILPATHLAAQRALRMLSVYPEHLILDYLQIADVQIPQMSLVKGDERSLSVAAASILAKTARDALLTDLDSAYPGYGFMHNKGYGTPAHLKALQRLGACPIHRYTFKPLKTNPFYKKYILPSELS